MADPSARTRLVRERRDQAIQAITRHYTTGEIELDEFEARLDRLYEARSIEDIGSLLADLPALPLLADVPATSVWGADRGSQLVLAVMGGAERKGAWTPARRINAFAIMGGMRLDFRQAVFGPGVTELTVIAMMGGVEIIVPPDLRVECEGFGLLGDFEGSSQASDVPRAGEPTLRIKGAAIMGGVEVTDRFPGESAKERRRRLHGPKTRRQGDS